MTGSQYGSVVRWTKARSDGGGVDGLALARETRKNQGAWDKSHKRPSFGEIFAMLRWFFLKNLRVIFALSLMPEQARP